MVLAEGRGDGPERARSEAGFGSDGVDGLPLVGIKLGLEGFEPLEIVEATAVGSGPAEQQAQPQGISYGGGLVTGERDQAEGNILTFFCGEAGHGFMEEEFVCAVGCAWLADDLLDEPALASGHRRCDKISAGGTIAQGDEDAAIADTAEGVGFDEEMHGRHGAGIEPVAEYLA